MVDFTLECFQNEYLPEGGSEVNALVTITASGTSRPAAGAPIDDGPVRRAEIIMIDASGSMDGSRLREARRAAAAAIDCIEDGVRFAILAGNHVAWRLYPDVAGLALSVSSPATREDARQAVSRLKAGGGTAIGKWIELAAGLFGSDREHQPRHPADRRQGRGRVARGPPTGPRRGVRDLPVRLPRGGDRLERGRAPLGSRPRCSDRPTSWPIRRP